MMASIYRTLLREIAADNYQVLHQRVSLTPLIHPQIPRTSQLSLRRAAANSAAMARAWPASSIH